jgi:hypothetical protein
MAPVRANIASRSVVLPLWKGPTSAMHRGPRGLLTSCPIAASSSGARPLIGSAGGMLRPSRDFGKRENVAAVHRDGRHVSSTALRGVLTTKQSSLRFGNWITSRSLPTGAHSRDPLARSDESALRYRPGRSSRLSSPAATLNPVWPCTLSGCSAIELSEPPTSTLPPSPTPTDALPCAPA